MIGQITNVLHIFFGKRPDMLNIIVSYVFHTDKKFDRVTFTFDIYVIASKIILQQGRL